MGYTAQQGVDNIYETYIYFNTTIYIPLTTKPLQTLLDLRWYTSQGRGLGIGERVNEIKKECKHIAHTL